MIPEEWEKVYLYAEVSEGFSYVYFYYCPVHHSSCLTSRKISYQRYGV
ncbi:antitoxin YezG family protein [Thermoactinomyces vulgaris]|nr:MULTISPECIES: immunity protein YezG family protein [Thermoactinomyces]MCF6135363.1 antitoxin YezG family protein [Thermoactinomyces vulgaris]